MNWVAIVDTQRLFGYDEQRLFGQKGSIMGPSIFSQIIPQIEERERREKKKKGGKKRKNSPVLKAPARTPLDFNLYGITPAQQWKKDREREIRMNQNYNEKIDGYDPVQ